MKNKDSISSGSSSQWESEYQKGGIPSSIRARPSNVVVEFLEFVRSNLPGAHRALDIGCGTGRNSIYLASQGFDVTAFDFVPSQVDALRAAIDSDPKLKIRATVGDVSATWPCCAEAIDIAVDCFVFKHQIELDTIKHYVEELSRCLKPGGLFMLFFATKDDGYYRQFPTDTQDGYGTIIVDAGNGIASRLYECRDIEAFFSSFELLLFREKVSRNDMHGRTYDRRSGLAYLRKPVGAG